MLAYLKKHDVQRHIGSHNLKSPWVSGVNFYFPFSSAEALLAGIGPGTSRESQWRLVTSFVSDGH